MLFLLFLSSLGSALCSIPGNSDISGPGVRAALYAQNLLCFIPAIWAIWDGKVSDYELESMETHSTTNLLLAFAILISCIVQALTQGLTNFHASIVLSMSWMNNTNAFVYFLLYIHYKSQPGEGHVEPRWSTWWTHVIDKLRSAMRLPNAIASWRVSSVDGGQDNESAAKKTELPNLPALKGGVKVLFRRFALVLGSFHLTLMAALGIWLWSNPRMFGTSDSSCAVDYAHVAVLGTRVPFGSNVLRIFSLVIYGLFLLPGLNLLLPMAIFLAISFWHYSRLSKVTPSTDTDSEKTSAPEPAVPQAPYTRIVRTLRSGYTQFVRSPIFPVCVGLGLLLLINVVFVVDIELTLTRNTVLQDEQESEWGFGQILAMLLVFIPLRDLVEMILARRLRRQEEQIKRHELTAAWKSAIVRKDSAALMELAKKGADPNVTNEGGSTGLEVAVCAKDWDAVAAITSAAPLRVDANTLFHDGRTAMQVVALDEDWDHLKLLIDAGADINTRNSKGETPLELATFDGRWALVGKLLDLKADINTVFSAPYQRSSGSVLQAACRYDQIDQLKSFLKAGAAIHQQGGEYGSTLQEACAPSCSAFTVVEVLLKNGADLNVKGGYYGTALQAVCDGLREARLYGSEKTSFDIAKLLVENGADCNVQGGYNQTALQAASHTSLDAVKLLLDNGADPDLHGGASGSALAAACYSGKIDIVKTLLDSGASIDLQFEETTLNPRGTALHAACYGRHIDIVRLLLGRGANPNILGACSRTPLSAISEWKWGLVKTWQESDRSAYDKIADLLREHGAV